MLNNSLLVRIAVVKLALLRVHSSGKFQYHFLSVDALYIEYRIAVAVSVVNPELFVSCGPTVIVNSRRFFFRFIVFRIIAISASVSL